MHRLALFLLVSISLTALAQPKISREDKLKLDRKKVEADGFWIYNDLAKGIEEAKKTGKPLLVVLRCVPCVACMGIDASVLNSGELQPLLDQFVCVRVINANALDLSLYPFMPDRGDYLLFLGRMTADKGAHRAVAVAMESGLPLKLAGKCREPLEQRYFDELVRPHLSERIQYVGEVTHGEKVELLQHARATLFPIEWDEPFGLVMIESMACGTPVIATRYGAVPEVIEDGVSGVIVDRWRDMPDALERADTIDPRVQREAVEERFSPERMVADYVAAYEATIERWATPASSR